ncbi:MAG: hypothetical protein RL133_860 [Pseudomonadota bacterium]
MPPLIARALFVLLVTLTVVTLTAGLTARYWVWPQIARFLNSPEALAELVAPALKADALNLQTEGAQAVWDDWLAPQISIARIQVMDPDGRPTAVAEGLRAHLGPRSLLSLLKGYPVFSRLELDRLTLLGERGPEGQLHLGGFLLSGRDRGASGWYAMLAQQGPLWLGHISLSWRDSDAFGTVELSELRVRLREDHVAIRAADLDLAAWLPLAQRMDWVPADARLGGHLRNAVVEWSGDLREAGAFAVVEHLRRLNLEADIEGVQANQMGRLASLSAVSGRLSVTGGEGRLSLLPAPLEIHLPRDFSAGPLRFTQAQGDLEWRVTDWTAQPNGLPTGLTVSVQRLAVENADLSAAISGTQELLGTDLGRADFKGQVLRARPDRVHYYLPSTVGKDARDWMRRAFVSSKPVAGQFQLMGAVAEFPFDQRPGAGRFDAQLTLQDAALNVAPGWPRIQADQIDVGFAGPELSVRAAKARMGDAPLFDVVGRIPHLDDPQPKLEIAGRFDAPLSAILSTVNASPVLGMLGGLTDGALGSGRSELGLALVIDLKNPDLTTVKGELRLDKAGLELQGVPALSSLTGRIGFDERGLLALDVKGRALGGPVTLALGGSRQQLAVQGEFRGADLERWMREALEVPLRGVIAGQTPYALSIQMGRSRLQLQAQSSLRGLTLGLPAPLQKGAEEAWGLTVSMDRQRAGTDRTEQILLSTQGQRLGLHFERRERAGQVSRRGMLAVQAPANLPSDPGLVLRVKAKSFALLDWLSALDENLTAETGPPGASVAARGEPLLRTVEVQADQLSLGSQALALASLRANRKSAHWALNLEAREAAGQLIWRPAPEDHAQGSRGVLVARLSRLWLSAAEPTNPAAQSTTQTALKEAQRWPSLDLVAEDFRRGKTALGRLVIDAAPRPQENSWYISRLSLDNPDAELLGSGRWAAKAQSGGGSETRLDLELKIKKGEGLLARMGYPGLIRETPGGIKGVLSWDGAPTDFRVRALRGQLALDLESGRFLKADPGLAKLISVLNLQSLPKRMTLDFRDIFSEGFSFERVRGDVLLNEGQAETKNLRIVGVQASVFIEGTANLTTETQNIRVLVLPELNAGLASLGYALINPAIGLGSFLAQFVLRDPLRQILAYEYALTGPWDDPTVRELPRSEQKSP